MEKNIEYYIKEVLMKNGITENIEKLIQMINNIIITSNSAEEIIIKLDKIIEQYILSHKFKQLYNLPLTYNGITLNNQDID